MGVLSLGAVSRVLFWPSLAAGHKSCVHKEKAAGLGLIWADSGWARIGPNLRFDLGKSTILAFSAKNWA